MSHSISLILPDGSEDEFDNVCCSDCFGLSEKQFKFAITQQIMMDTDVVSISSVKKAVIKSCEKL